MKRERSKKDVVKETEIETCRITREIETEKDNGKNEKKKEDTPRESISSSDVFVSVLRL